jgi:organic radical activating enzyme
MPYFNQTNHIDESFDDFKIELDNLLSGVNSIIKLNFLGGEPLINKDLPKMIEYSAGKDKVGIIEIITNGTLIPNKELIETIKKFNYKVYFYISNYSKNTELKSVLKHDKIIEVLRQNDIKFQLPTDITWFEEKPLLKRNYTLEQAKKIFINCSENPCICVFNGKIHICAKSSSGYELGFIKIKDSDFIDLRVTREIGGGGGVISKKIIEFYNKDYFEACKYCIKTNKEVLLAEQLKGE